MRTDLNDVEQAVLRYINHYSSQGTVWHERWIEALGTKNVIDSLADRGLIEYRLSGQAKVLVKSTEDGAFLARIYGLSYAD